MKPLWNITGNYGFLTTNHESAYKKSYNHGSELYLAHYNDLMHQRKLNLTKLWFFVSLMVQLVGRFAIGPSQTDASGSRISSAIVSCHPTAGSHGSHAGSPVKVGDLTPRTVVSVTSYQQGGCKPPSRELGLPPWFMTKSQQLSHGKGKLLTYNWGTGTV